MATVKDIGLRFQATATTIEEALEERNLLATVEFRVVYNKTEIAKSSRFGLSIELRGSDEAEARTGLSNRLTNPPLFSFPLGRPRRWSPFDPNGNTGIVIAAAPSRRRPLEVGVRYAYAAVVPSATLDEDPGTFEVTRVIVGTGGQLSEETVDWPRQDEIFAVVRLRQLGREIRGFGNPVSVGLPPPN